ncbi:ATP-binding protein [Altericroceibacterium spongiae]|uniref:histidine kinase n=1 Tax=Altericroceibacterium spongiae TaxID=2320269 RepID=A0A420ERN1_9SPHN|nr:ATP-binding protein [Altericroceibacterium spongiae]RKF23283.1 ATP-binding protein [Altericroceibacterium spongiae]
MIRAPESIARAASDGHDRLIEADEPLAGLQRACGGEIPGLIAIPALLELVRKARQLGLKLSRPLAAEGEHGAISAWIEVMPAEEGCEIAVIEWNEEGRENRPDPETNPYRSDIERQLAALTARIASDRTILSAEAHDPALEEFARQMQGTIGQPLSDLIEMPEEAGGQLSDLQALDGMAIDIDGSDRSWVVSLIPLEPGRRGNAGESRGFALHILPAMPDEEEPEETPPPPESFLPDNRLATEAVIGQEIAPVLRQPISRIIANAETIRTQMAGPLAEEYASYAADIAAAGEHLLGLLDDLADLEVVESDHFTTSPDRIDLAQVAHQACGILNMRALERDMRLRLPADGEKMPAIGEFRRVLQILLNLIGNAIRYAPQGSEIRIILARHGDRARITVEDEGEGLSVEEQNRLFRKFERLGRKNDGGSGLGLYISRRLARAMSGDLQVESEKGQGARFTLDLPARE